MSNSETNSVSSLSKMRDAAAEYLRESAQHNFTVHHDVGGAGTLVVTARPEVSNVLLEALYSIAPKSHCSSDWRLNDEPLFTQAPPSPMLRLHEAIADHVSSNSSPAAKTPADVMDQMAATFRERNAVYGDNYKRVAPVIQTLFPDGVPKELLFSDRWHLFELVIVKLSRYAVSNLSHKDSIHDAAVYCAMIESETP